MSETNLESRNSLPPELKFLLEQHPRETWRSGQLKGLGRTWLAIHGNFRDTVTRMSAQLDAVRETGTFAPAFAGRFAHEASGLLGHLNAHHAIEDDHYFPIFQHAEPRLVRGFEIMDADHHVIHDAIERFAGEGNQFLQKIGRAEGAPDAAQSFAVDRMAEELSGFTRLLRQHLADEEDLVIPLILEKAELG
ncbi:MAG: hemerythrin domain-containing protein [Paracoccus sp. (in: a-proteobacteria)]|nr:hemerythrin domain-containing protein [Paracoccus sp. (in: a-proteobacteria)]